MDVKLVPAQAAACQAERFAELAQLASDDVFTDFFGARARYVLESMFWQADNHNSLAYSAFLQVGASIAGLLQAYSAATARAHARRSNWLYLRYARLQVFRLLAVSIDFSNILGFLGQNLRENDFYIAFLAIYPQYQRRGFSKTLLDHASDLARQAACQRLTLDVDERNKAAISAYRRAGFEIIDQSKRIQREGERWGILRMAKDIPPSA